MPTVVPFETLTDLYENLVEKYKNSKKIAFAYKPSPNKEYQNITWDSTSEDVMAVSGYLLEQGVQKNDRIAILSENRYEWAVVDLAIQLVGGINVALYTTLPPSQCEYILKDSGAKIFFVSTGIQLKKAVEVFKNCKKLKQVIAFDTPNVKKYMENKFVDLFENILIEGGKAAQKTKREISKRENAVTPEDIATLIYTSGTTGKPKGAMLTRQPIKRLPSEKKIVCYLSYL
jgi:long-chain acyl-CoA synthetase